MRELVWVEELLPPGYIKKPMFGGFAYYYEARFVLCLFEKTGDRHFKNKNYDFELWNGCLFPMERENHATILTQYPFLIHHPVLPKWLYLPTDTEAFESNVEILLKEIRKRNLKFGIIPKSKIKKTNKAIKKNIKKASEAIDTRKPRMFADEPVEKRFQAAVKLTDLKNLGPVSEIEFKKAGIVTVQQFVKLGWKKSMSKLAHANPKNINTIFAYAIIGALKNQYWSKISGEDKLEARDFMKELKKLRKL